MKYFEKWYICVTLMSIGLLIHQVLLTTYN